METLDELLEKFVLPDNLEVIEDKELNCTEIMENLEYLELSF